MTNPKKIVDQFCQDSGNLVDSIIRELTDEEILKLRCNGKVRTLKDFSDEEKKQLEILYNSKIHPIKKSEKK